MFKLKNTPFEGLQIDQVEERRYEDVFSERYQLMYRACLRTLTRQDLDIDKQMRIYGAQVLALIRMT